MRCIPTDSEGITLGVDTHKDTHVAVALDGLGRRPIQVRFSSDVSRTQRTAEDVDWHRSLRAYNSHPIKAKRNQ